MNANIKKPKVTEQENNLCTFKTTHLTAPQSKIIMLTEILCGLIILVYLTGCSTLNIDTAKNLSAAGQAVSFQSAAGIFASDEKYQGAMDAEAFFHGYAGMDIPAQLAWGESGAGDLIPPNSDVIFEIELVDIVK